MHPVVKYFSEERAESVLFIIAGAIAEAIALYLFFGLKTSVAKGAAIPLALVAILELAGGTGIFFRSPEDSARVKGFVKNAPHNISAVEVPRMKRVMPNFIIYKNVEKI